MNRIQNLAPSNPSISQDQSSLNLRNAEALVLNVKIKLQESLLQASKSALGDLSGTDIGSSVGTASQPLSSGGAVHIPNADRMPFYDQQGTQGCGTTSLSMVLEYYGVHVSREDIDAAIRRGDNFLGSSVDDIIEFARDHGVQAEGYNNGTWEELKSMIDGGHPVMVSVDGDGSGTAADGSSQSLPDGRHLLVITGYETDPATGKEYVLYHDPNYGDDPTTAAKEGGELRMSVDDFKEAWGAETFGVKNYFIAFGPGLPPGRNDGVEGALGVHAGATNISNGFDRIFSPDCFGSFVHGLFQAPGGIIQTVGCGVGALFQVGSNWLHGAVEGIPVLENLVQPFADVFGGVGAAVADVFNGIGEAFDDIGGAFENLFDGDVGGFVEGVGEAVGDVVGGVADAVGDAVDAVGDAVSDFFSGW